ncbi:hypothetical protein QYF36_024264 [Acer negundo]|nr:hypothetical protein QYF36_024264 [Acer negundo]
MARVVIGLEACSNALRLWNGINKLSMKVGIKEKKKELACMDASHAFWQQSLKVFWLKEGDCNTKFFHAKATSRRSRNRLRGLFDTSGTWRTDKAQMGDIINRYFIDIFVSAQLNHVQLNLVCNSVENRIPSHLTTMLNMKFTAEEIRVALFQMSPSKALSYDGFLVDFFQRFWSVVGENVMSICLGCLNDSHPVGMVNHML